MYVVWEICFYWLLLEFISCFQVDQKMILMYEAKYKIVLGMSGDKKIIHPISYLI